MQIRFVLAVCGLLALHIGAAAEIGPSYYCDPLRADYPTVLQCPVPWRTVSPPDQGAGKSWYTPFSPREFQDYGMRGGG